MTKREPEHGPHPTKTLIADDHALIREDMRAQLLGLGDRRIVKHKPGVAGASPFGSENVSDMRAVLRLGAMGYVNKNETSAVMLGAARLVLDGGMVVPAALASLGADVLPAPAPASILTERQLDVLRLIVEGKSNKEIARAAFGARHGEGPLGGDLPRTGSGEPHPGRDRGRAAWLGLRRAATR